MQKKPGFGKPHPWQQRVDILRNNGEKDNQAKAQIKENFTVHPTLSFHFREAIWYFQFRPRPPRIAKHCGQVEIENANNKILKVQ